MAEEGNGQTEALDSRRVEAAQLKDAMQQLIATNGWRVLASQIEEKVKLRIDALLEVTKTQDEILIRENMKGSCQALREVLGMPLSNINIADEIIAGFISEEKQREAVEPFLDFSGDNLAP